MTELSFEGAMQRLEEIVDELEQGNLPLDESLKIYEEGMALIKFCSAKLEETENKVKMLVKNSGGFEVKPFDIA